MLIQRYTQFLNLEKCHGLVSPPHLVHDFSRAIFFLLYTINWPNFFFWLSLLFEILGNMCIEIICFQVYDVIGFENNFSFLVKSFFYLTKKSRKKSKCRQNENSFKGEINKYSDHFRGISVARNCLRTKSTSFIIYQAYVQTYTSYVNVWNIWPSQSTHFAEIMLL